MISSMTEEVASVGSGLNVSRGGLTTRAGSAKRKGELNLAPDELLLILDPKEVWPPPWVSELGCDEVF